MAKIVRTQPEADGAFGRFSVPDSPLKPSAVMTLSLRCISGFHKCKQDE